MLAALAARGQHYQLATESTGYDVEAPPLLSSGFADLRVNQHEAVLARTDDRLTLANPRSGQFAVEEMLSGNPGTVALPWSWASSTRTRTRTRPRLPGRFRTGRRTGTRSWPA
jgi:hypothetical protein